MLSSVSFNLVAKQQKNDTDRPLAHMDAYNAGILHRDISPGNIIIHEGSGLLIDWDLSKPIDMLSTKPGLPRRATRTVQPTFVAGPIIADF
jgi:serine/threonine protein kinase